MKFVLINYHTPENTIFSTVYLSQLLFSRTIDFSEVIGLRNPP
jgi:hypothetical protein